MSIDITTLALAKEYTNRMVGSGGTGSGVDGGYYTPGVTQPTADTMQISFAPSKSDMPAVNPVTVNLPVSENSGQNPNQSGLSDAAKTLLITILRNGVYSTDQSANITALGEALASSGGGGGGEDIPDDPDVPDTGVSITQSGSALILSGVPAITSITQSGNVLTLA